MLTTGVYIYAGKVKGKRHATNSFDLHSFCCICAIAVLGVHTNDVKSTFGTVCVEAFRRSMLPSSPNVQTDTEERSLIDAPPHSPLACVRNTTSFWVSLESWVNDSPMPRTGVPSVTNVLTRVPSGQLLGSLFSTGASFAGRDFVW